jgi:hypothetical protein
MDDKELFAVWKEGDEKEKRTLEHHQGEYLGIAQSQSKDVFRKIRKNIVWETIMSVIIAVVFPFFFWDHAIFFWMIVVMMLASIVAGVKVYGKYLQDMNQLNESSMVESLRKKLLILSRYVKQLNFYLMVFLPLGFAVGFAFALKQEEITLARILVLAGVTLPFLGLLIWLGKKYIYALYGKHLKSIKGIYQRLGEN